MSSAFASYAIIIAPMPEEKRMAFCHDIHPSLSASQQAIFPTR